MQAASPFQAPVPATHGSVDVWDFAENCLVRTAECAHEARVATPAEISHAISLTREQHINKKPADLLEILARVLGHGEEHLGQAIYGLGERIATTLTPYPPLVPFAAKLIAPSAFYDSFDHIHKTARVLLSPVVFAEDTDAIGTASINPVAASLLADEIRASVFRRFAIRPFVTIARLEYESWCFLTRKHFEL